MRRGPVLVLLLAPRLGHAQGVEEVLRGGQEALRSGAIREAIERYEAFADQGGLHPDVSYSRGVAYLARVKEGALEEVRSEVARRRARRGASPEVAVSPGALRAFVGLLPENGWSWLAATGSLALTAGLVMRRGNRTLRLVSGVAMGLGGGLLGLGGATAAYARYLRLEVGLGVVVVEEARVVDERGVPTTQPSLPEAARVDILERKGGLLRVRWGEVSGYTGAQNVRIVGPHKP